ncbi:hypothetical protein ACFLZZ_02040 [Nanoarchaeota archaeon]
MIDWKEMLTLASSALVLGYIIAFTTFTEFNLKSWFIWFLLGLLILTVNTVGRKLTALFYDADAKISHWHIKRYGFWKWMYFKKLFPIWFILPVFLIWITDGFISWLAIITFEASPLKSRARRKFSEVTEWDLALIAIGGLLLNAVLAFVSYLLGFGDFAKINLMFILFNLIPISNLDGAKVLFGSRFLGVFAVIFALAMLILLDLTGAVPALLLAIIIGIVAVFLYYYLKL